MPSLSLLSSLAAASHSFPSRADRASSASLEGSPSSTSLYATFKVLQLIHTFRKRARTHARQSRAPRTKKTTLTQAFCQDLEYQVFEEIDRYLGRKSNAHRRKGLYPRRRPLLVTKNSEAALKHQSYGIEWSSTLAILLTVDRVLKELNGVVQSGSTSLVDVAKDHQLFLSRSKQLVIYDLPLHELARLLVQVLDLLASLRKRRLSGVKTLAEGNELLDFTLGESQTANFEHLLLCLKDQLLRKLTLKVVDCFRKQLVECQRDHSLHFEEWFFEFPDARHPVSTTWPWSIRPSLAVIWGVCWMFFDSDQSSEEYIEFWAQRANELADDMLQGSARAQRGRHPQLRYYQGEHIHFAEMHVFSAVLMSCE